VGLTSPTRVVKTVRMQDPKQNQVQINLLRESTNQKHNKSSNGRIGQHQVKD